MTRDTTEYGPMPTDPVVESLITNHTTDAGARGPGSGCVYPGCDPIHDVEKVRGWLIDAVCFAHEKGRLSEGQACRVLNVARVTWRGIKDDWLDGIVHDLTVGLEEENRG